MSDKPRARADGWINIATGVGLLGRDKRLGAYHQTDRPSFDDLEDLWAGDDMAARIIETLPTESTRQGFDIRIESQDAGLETTKDPGNVAKAQENNTNDPENQVKSDPNAQKSDAFGGPPGGPPALPAAPKKPPAPIEPRGEDTRAQAEALLAAAEDLEYLDRFWEALASDRAFGGAAILIGAQDGSTDLKRPLNMDTIRSVDWLTVLSPRELYPIAWYGDPQAPKYGEPEIYRLNPEVSASSPDKPIVAQMVEVHESRLLLFKGIRVSRRQARALNGWGDSVLTRVHSVLRDFHAAYSGTGIIIQDFAQSVIKIKDLADLIGTNEENAIIARIQALELCRSTARAVIIDAEEDYIRQSTSVAGLSDLLDKFAQRLAAAADMPVTLLMGMSPAGMNATGESDTRFFYDRVRGYQIRKVKPALEKFFRILMRAKNGPTGGVEPENWSIEPKPLWQPSEAEQVATRKTQADTDAIYMANGVLTPEEVAASRFGGDAYSIETTIDFTGRQELAASFEEEEAAHEEEKAVALEEMAKAKPEDPENTNDPESDPKGTNPIISQDPEESK